MNDKPIFFNLLKMRLPIGGWVSILHRGSGVLLALALPGLLYGFMLSLRSEADFALVSQFLAGGLGWLIGLALLWALLHHFFAGLRHLGFDLGWGEALRPSRRSAWAALLLGLLLTVLIAYWSQP